MEAVYIIQLREFIGTNIFKIGRTSREGTKRSSEYPSNSHLRIHKGIIDSKNIERNLKKIFGKNFKHEKKYGSEYFSGKYEDMERLFLECCANESKTVTGTPCTSNVNTIPQRIDYVGKTHIFEIDTALHISNNFGLFEQLIYMFKKCIGFSEIQEDIFITMCYCNKELSLSFAQSVGIYDISFTNENVKFTYKDMIISSKIKDLKSDILNTLEYPIDVLKYDIIKILIDPCDMDIVNFITKDNFMECLKKLEQNIEYTYLYFLGEGYDKYVLYDWRNKLLWKIKNYHGIKNIIDLIKND